MPKLSRTGEINSSRIKAHAESLNVAQTQMIEILLNVYEVQDLQPLLQQLKTFYQIGLTPNQIKQLSAMHTLISTMLHL